MAKELKYATSTKKDEDHTVKNFEDILESIGGFGRFQVMMLVFILFFEIPSAFLAFIPVFVGSVPSEWECVPKNSKGVNTTTTGNLDSYENEENDTSIITNEDYFSENSIKYDSKEICLCNGTKDAPYHTIVAEWELICDLDWLPSSITSFQMFGMFFGNTIPPQMSDWYGRKTAFVGLIIIMGIGQGASALATDPYLFAAARFICGIGLAGYLSLNGIYTMEFLTPAWRQLGGCLGPLGEGVMILALLGYFIKPWRLLMLATTLPLASIMIMIPFTPESPRWLLRNKRLPETEQVLKYIAKVNGKDYVDCSDLLKSISEEEGLVGNIRFSYLDLFRRPDVRKKTLIFVGIWFCWAFTYFGLSFNIRNFGVDPYLMLGLMGLADAIGFRAALTINNRLGRRKALVVFSGISAMFFLPVAICQLVIPTGSPAVEKTLEIGFIVCILLGKLAVAGARSAIRVLTVESYPVAIRTMGFGVSRVSATLGGIAAPQLAYIGTLYPSVPTFGFAILGFMGSLLSLLLDETSGKPLKDQINTATNGINTEIEETNGDITLGPFSVQRNKVGPTMGTFFVPSTNPIESDCIKKVPPSFLMRSQSI